MLIQSIIKFYEHEKTFTNVIRRNRSMHLLRFVREGLGRRNRADAERPVEGDDMVHQGHTDDDTIQQRHVLVRLRRRERGDMVLQGFGWHVLQDTRNVQVHRVGQHASHPVILQGQRHGLDVRDTHERQPHEEHERRVRVSEGAD